MQQELGNVTRQLAALTEKRETDGALSEADKAKLQKAQQRIEKIRAYASRPDRTGDDYEVDPLADQVLELTEKASRQDQLEAALADTQSRLANVENDRNWQIARSRFDGLDVDAIWKKAITDAGDTLADSATPAAVHRLASRWFEERCEAAKKRKGEDPRANNKTTDAKAPSTYRVGTAPGTAPVLSDEEEALAMARELVKEI